MARFGTYLSGAPHYLRSFGRNKRGEACQYAQGRPLVVKFWTIWQMSFCSSDHPQLIYALIFRLVFQQADQEKLSFPITLLVLAANRAGAKNSNLQSAMLTHIRWGGWDQNTSWTLASACWFCKTRCTKTVPCNQFHIHMLMHTLGQGKKRDKNSNLYSTFCFFPEEWYCLGVTVMFCTFALTEMLPLEYWAGGGVQKNRAWLWDQLQHMWTKSELRICWRNRKEYFLERWGAFSRCWKKSCWQAIVETYPGEACG